MNARYSKEENEFETMKDFARPFSKEKTAIAKTLQMNMVSCGASNIFRKDRSSFELL